MAPVHLIAGPPGTGKTYTLIRRRLRALIEAGVAPSRIAVCSYTRAAADEAIERAQEEFDLGQQRPPFWNTLHGIGLRHIREGSPHEVTVATAQHWRDFFSAHGIQGGGRDLSDFEDGDGGENEGDHLRAFLDWRHINLLGAAEGLSRYAERFPDGSPIGGARVAWFEQAWEDCKREQGLCDYTDMLRALAGASVPEIDWLIVDEAQDLNPLQVRIVQGWMRQVETIIGCDVDQAIYGFQGADPGWLLQWRPEVALDESRRVPRRIQARAAALIARNRRRHGTAWRPRDEEGSIAEGDLDLLPYTVRRTPGSWYVLTRNRFYLKAVAEVCNQAGLPYWNRSEWCPLKRLWEKGKFGGAPSAMASMLRLALGMPVAVDEAEAVWRGHKELWLPGAGLAFREWRRRGEGYLLDRGDLQRVASDQLAGALQQPAATLRLFGLQSWQTRYYVDLAARGGAASLFERPRLEIGTVHSVKGLEADHVALLPNFTRRTAYGYDADPEPERRVWYVGMTRARHSLHNLGKIGGRTARYFDEL